MASDDDSTTEPPPTLEVYENQVWDGALPAAVGAVAKEFDKNRHSFTNNPSNKPIHVPIERNSRSNKATLRKTAIHPIGQPTTE